MCHRYRRNNAAANRVRQYLASYVAERVWRPSQSNRNLRGLDSLASSGRRFEIVRWVFRLGDAAAVLGQSDLRDQVGTILSCVAARYSAIIPVTKAG